MDERGGFRFRSLLDRSRSYDMHSEGPPKADLEGLPHLKVPECLVCNEYECFIY